MSSVVRRRRVFGTPIHPPACPLTPLMKKFKNKHEREKTRNRTRLSLVFFRFFFLLLNNRKCSHKGISSFLKFKFGFESDGHG
ncbi:hypothetical protein GHT06_022462 [Daphnia sinensis]|uniref:Uncharacterized protein n=1 Tax=Daphnia sinensis TaxID=1820382 RepID=A0AAD5KYQ2_9CRUS|nr:hypothetical protein GHT06_022462 [Daphnia sinensis]